MRRFLALAVLLAVAPLAAGAQAPKAAAQPKGATAAPAAPKATPFDTALLMRADSGRILGSDQAKVWVVIFSDFQCPYCKAWHDQVDEVLRRDYVNAGKVKVAFMNFPLASIHKNAVAAADAAMCAASQRKFWAMHDALFASQEQWAQKEDPAAAFEAAAQKAGADVPQLKACVAARKSRPLVEADASRGMRAGVQSTPSFFVGDTAVAGAMSAADFRKILDQQLAKKAAAPGASK